MKPKQRFVAGAVCPECNEIDSLLLNMDDQSISCVDCGYQKTENERDTEHSKKESQANKKTLPDNVDVSNIIRITNLND